MATREATCHCGQLRLEVTGEPFAVSICNCLACQRRTGSAFGMQAGFRADQVQIGGPLQRLHANLRRGGQEGARLPFLPRLRLAGLLHGTDGARPGRRLGRLLRRSLVPAADRGRELLEAHPGNGYLLYNVACCESLAGRTPDALEHLGRAIGMAESVRDLARNDSDFDPIRGEPAFEELISS